LRITVSSRIFCNPRLRDLLPTLAVPTDVPVAAEVAAVGLLVLTHCGIFGFGLREGLLRLAAKGEVPRQSPTHGSAP
jgi:hypothetical protein